MEQEAVIKSVTLSTTETADEIVATQAQVSPTPVDTHVSLEDYIEQTVQQHLTHMGKQLMTHLTKTCTSLLHPTTRSEDPSGNRPLDLQAPEDPADAGNRPARDQPNLKVLFQQEIGSGHVQVNVRRRLLNCLPHKMPSHCLPQILI